MFDLTYLGGLGGAPGPWSMTSVLIPFRLGGLPLLLAGSRAMGSYALLAPGPELRPVASAGMSGQTAVFDLTDAALVAFGSGEAAGYRLYSLSASRTTLEMHRLASGPETGPQLTPAGETRQIGGLAMELSSLVAARVGGEEYLIAADHDRPGLVALRLDGAGRPSLADRVADGVKTALDGVTALVDLTIAGEVYVVSASAREPGLSSFHLGAGGRLTLADTLSPKDGLWVAGITALAGLEAHGRSWLIAGSAEAGNLSVVRINALGVMFPTSQRHDDLLSRFGKVMAVEGLTQAGRAFVVAGGTDGGVSLLELLPDGALFHHRSFEPGAQSGLLAAEITALALAFSGGGLQIHIGTSLGLATLEVDLAGLGQVLTGRPAAELLSGGAGADLLFTSGAGDTLAGGAGDDLLVSTVAGTVFRGGAGADVFRLGAGAAFSAISDFQPGVDILDLSQWGRVYSPAALTIRPRAYGAEISHGENSLRIYQEGGGQIPVDTWGPEDFLF